jgi:hypothetical protein
MGMLYHHLSEQGSDEDLQMAKKYYIESFTWSQLESLDNKLFKRSLKSLI